MTLSVVVPALDAAATLEHTLRALLDHPAVDQVVVVDDGSTDATAAIARRLGAVVVDGPGTGPAAARNRGVAATSGDLLAFCDADDRWIAPAVDPRVAALEADAELDGAWGQTVCVDEEGREAAPTHLGALHGLVVRRSAFDQVGPLDESLRLGEDLDWILRARGHLRIEMVDVPCYRYVLRAGSLSAGGGRRASGLLAAARLAAQRTAAAPVSVVVPSADAERYLGEAVRSIREQVPAPAAVVVADDASTDGSVAVAAEAGVQTVVLPERSGPNAARMAGVEATADELVAFCDADDVWPPGRLAAMVAALREHPEVAGVVGRVESFASPDRDVTGLDIPVGPQPGVVIGSLLVRRADLNAVGGLRTDLLGGELVALERALAAVGRPLLRIDQVVLHRRVHGDNLSIRRAPEVQRAYLRLAIEGAREAR